ncbi:N-acetylmuramoyl-L-alanine amidase-like domain-containing protein [Prevotella sp. 10(H)]|uniref:N-acetylmuramoyl-L-alanine amidase-like domain-containing protein n=1 Tax=Prevotella sp. 10(H) TaxID=1158294 RepID=UPI000AC0DAB6|nr:N-acetylmuramoyl-L-alanine amidase-like domain-containing protein [Prevotella sp. 10(H)]
MIFISFVLTSFSVKAGDIISTPADINIYKSYVKQFEGQKEKPIAEILINTAKYFLGKPYVASTLEVSGPERMVINLREFDCTTLVENCIALSQVIKSGDTSYKNFIDKLMIIRYRGGEVSGYTSRLHYTTDWIYENEKRGLFKDISVEVGGKKTAKAIDFMTTHPHLYKHLEDDTVNVSKMRKIENEINERNSYSIIPVSEIENKQEQIRNGDIIAFATSISGLDYSHIGIAFWQAGELHFIHASSKYKKVIIEKKTLLSYCQDIKSCMGISVLRLNN